MKKLVVLLCALLALGSSAQALEVSAPSALLMEKETGTVLFAKDEHAKLEPASVTKVMTLLLTMEAIDAGQLHYDDVVTASAHACSMGGSQIWLKENEQMTVSDMLKAVCSCTPPTAWPWTCPARAAPSTTCGRLSAWRPRISPTRPTTWSFRTPP